MSCLMVATVIQHFGLTQPQEPTDSRKTWRQLSIQLDFTTSYETVK